MWHIFILRFLLIFGFIHIFICEFSLDNKYFTFVFYKLLLLLYIYLHFICLKCIVFSHLTLIWKKHLSFNVIFEVKILSISTTFWFSWYNENIISILFYLCSTLCFDFSQFGLTDNRCHQRIFFRYLQIKPSSQTKFTDKC